VRRKPSDSDLMTESLTVERGYDFREGYGGGEPKLTIGQNF
jgi:hypothetical protein